MNIYVHSQAAGERVLASITRFLERRLRLKVNRKKSAVAPVEDRSFLGHRLSRTGRLGIAPNSLERIKQRVRRITKRNRGISLERMIGELNGFLSGWVTDFRYAAARAQLRRLDSWLRRRLRRVRLKQCKGFAATVRFLRRLGIWALRDAACGGSSGQGRPGCWPRPARAGGARPPAARPPAACPPRGSALTAGRPWSRGSMRCNTDGNRRVRTRTLGGVGGAEPQGSPLSRCVPGTVLIWKVEVLCRP